MARRGGAVALLQRGTGERWRAAVESKPDSVWTWDLSNGSCIGSGWIGMIVGIPSSTRAAVVDLDQMQVVKLEGAANWIGVTQ